MLTSGGAIRAALVVFRHENQIDSVHRGVEWFDKELKGSSASWTGAQAK